MKLKGSEQKRHGKQRFIRGDKSLGAKKLIRKLDFSCSLRTPGGKRNCKRQARRRHPRGWTGSGIWRELPPPSSVTENTAKAGEMTPQLQAEKKAADERAS